MHKKSRANRWICAARCDENEKAGGEEMGGAPPAALKEWFGCDAAKIAKLSYMGKAEKLSAR